MERKICNSNQLSFTNFQEGYNKILRNGCFHKQGTIYQFCSSLENDLNCWCSQISLSGLQQVTLEERRGYLTILLVVGPPNPVRWWQYHNNTQESRSFPLQVTSEETWRLVRLASRYSGGQSGRRSPETQKLQETTVGVWDLSEYI